MLEGYKLCGIEAACFVQLVLPFKLLIMEALNSCDSSRICTYIHATPARKSQLVLEGEQILSVLALNAAVSPLLLLGELWL